MVVEFDPIRIKYGDEKHLKGQELFNRPTRRDPLTGERPPMLVPPDFRNTYTIIGFCGLDKRTTAVHACIIEENGVMPNILRWR